MSGRATTLLICALLLVTVSSTPRATTDDLEDLLKQPVSPGTLGLLVTHTQDPRVGARWREALAHESPSVRAAAARLLLASGDGTAVADLRRILETDTDPGAALEAARALLIMGDSSDDDLVRAAGKRLNDERFAKAAVELRPTRASASPVAGVTPAGGRPGFRTVADLPDGYVADVLKVSRCVAKGEVVIAAVAVRYNEIRHLKELRWLPTQLSPQCSKAARAILAAGVLPAPPSVKSGDQHVIVLPMRQLFLECLANASGSAPPPITLAGSVGITPPRKTKHVNPTYPQRALSAGRPGTATLEATISSSGCVERLRVTASAAMDIDAEAIRAVSGWAFTPTIVKGVAVPVVITVTMQFMVE